MSPHISTVEGDAGVLTRSSVDSSLTRGIVKFVNVRAKVPELVREALIALFRPFLHPIHSNKSSEECFDMRPSQLGSLQGRLRPFAEHPTVSLGALKWIHAQVSNEAFCATPSFLSYAPVFLKLCGQAADDHPPQRPEAFEVRC